MTYEGDNHVLLQQVAKALMNDYNTGKLNKAPSVANQSEVSFNIHIYIYRKLLGLEGNAQKEVFLKKILFLTNAT